MAASQLGPYIEFNYLFLGGNPSGIPVELIPINVGSAGGVPGWIEEYGLQLVLDDPSPHTVFDEYGAGGVPQIAIINGAANANYQQWEILALQTGYGSGDYHSFRSVIDSVVYKGIVMSVKDSGCWNFSSTWDTDQEPTIDDDTAVGGHTVTVAEDGVAASLMINHPDGVVEIGQTAQLWLANRADVGTGELRIFVGASSAGLLRAGGDVVVRGGTLSLQAVDARVPGPTLRTIISTEREGEIVGNFAVEPTVHDPRTGRVGHLGRGVFHMGLDYVRSGPAPEDPVKSVTADLYVAHGGDNNGDRYVDVQDINTLVANFGADPGNMDWTDGDCAGGDAGRGDGYVDVQDINILVANFGIAPSPDPGPTPDPGPADEGSVIAEYNYLTGEFVVSENRVYSWCLTSDSLFNGFEGHPDNHVNDVLPKLDTEFMEEIIRGDVANNPVTVGEGHTSIRLPAAADIHLGQLISHPEELLALGLDPSNPDSVYQFFSLEYVVVKGGQEVLQGEIVVVPEPGTVAMLAGGLLGLLLLLLWRRRSM